MKKLPDQRRAKGGGTTPVVKAAARKGVSLEELVAWCDGLLKPQEFEDYPGAVNGLQVQNRGQVHAIAAAVDATLETITRAVEAGAGLLLVHHGLFWSPSHPWVKHRYQQMRVLLDNDLAVYSAHLPLDAHPAFGNNILLARALGFRRCTPFFQHKGKLLGWQTRAEISREDLCQKLARAVAFTVKCLPGGPPTCRRIGIVTGGAGNELHLAAAAGIDTFITGEGSHWTHGAAEELKLNVLYAGHYATETFGVQALGSKLSRRFQLPFVFIDHPSGL